MAPFSRFGASKFRNAVPHVPSKEEWYRSCIPPAAASTSSLSTFSGEIKSNREWIVTVTPGGEISYRSYVSAGTTAGVGTGKVGNGQVGDWDLSRLEDGTVVVGGVDGSIYVYKLPPSSAPTEPLQHIYTIRGNSAVSNIALHPTIPFVLLASSIGTPLGIYNLAANPSSPSISLAVSEPKGLWALDWSHDGKKVAAIGKSGTAYIFDPRSSNDPIVSRQLPLQPLKPVRLTWVGDDIFVTSFSKTRNREYHLFSGQSLSTTFTNTLDTSPGPLIPVVDNERKLVYISARGDMSLRQVEMGGPTGYQETIHPLPSQLSLAALSIAWPGNLPVMSAQIATILVGQVDKDGDAILPLGIRVPRRQLIDFHDDLYPEITGSIPEQTAEEWFEGSDKMPLFFSLNPARRGVWEKRLQDVSNSTGQSSEVEKSPVVKNEATPSGASKTTIDAVAPRSSAVDLEGTPLSVQSQPEKEPSVPSTPNELAVSGPTEAVVTVDTPTARTAEDEATGPRPPLEGNETYISTEYKGRILADHIAQQLERHRKEGKQGPLMVGLQGPQGCGKTTLCNSLLGFLQSEPRNYKIAVLSLDDLYKTNRGLKDVASQHPDNKLLAGRGPPGTHDPELAVNVLSAIQDIKAGKTVDLPIFDKSLCGGEGDRSTEVVKVSGPLDVFILEGWSMGFAPLSEVELNRRYESKTSQSDTSYFLSHPIQSLVELNNYLADFSSQVYKPFSTIIQVEPESYKYIFDWRLEQERNMKAANGGKGMTDDQVQKFVERYMPGYELWKEGIWGDNQPWNGQGLRIWYGKNREVLRVETPEAKVEKSENEATQVIAAEPPIIVEARDKPSENPTIDQTTETKPAEPERQPISASIPPPLRQVVEPSPPQGTAAGSVSSIPYNPGWSRKFLAGKSPLIPSYDQIPTLSTLHQDSQILRCTPHLVFFPIQGPGGRIGVHPLVKKGRMTTGGEGYLSGGVEVTDYAVEPFERSRGVRVALAGEDGVVRVWTVGQEGVSGTGPEVKIVLKGQGIDKIAQVVFHPTAEDLVVLASNEGGSAHIRFFNLDTAAEVLSVPVDTTGIFNIAWSASGQRVAVAAKDGRILVLDPRDPSTLIFGKAHDSPRSFQIVWVDSEHLISVGFSRGSQRRINLYKIGSTIETIHSLLVDVSPSVLFPVYDPDTNILYVWGKGERQVQAYEVHPSNTNEPIAKLPSYTAGNPQLGFAFFSKKQVDVKRVEVTKALRLTAKTIEEVSFSIPRNKPDFFQDDIYRDTLDYSVPSTTAEKWLKGDDTLLRSISLQPEGMTRLSEAPQTTSKAKAKFVPAKDVLSEAEKKKREMDALFAKAKMDESSDEDDEPKRTGLDPPDDDW